MEEYKFNDTIVFLKDDEDPIFGSIICSKHSKSNMVTIKSSSKTVKIPFSKIKLVIYL